MTDNNKRLKKEESPNVEKDSNVTNIDLETIYLPVPTSLNPNVIQNIHPINIPYQMSMGSGVINPNTSFYNPFMNHPMLMVPNPNSNFNYSINNQGIIVPQAAGNDQFFYIPGNIISHNNDIVNSPIMSESLTNYASSQHGLESVTIEENIDNHIQQQVYFVPKLQIEQTNDTVEEDREKQIEKSPNDLEMYETFIVPVQIKKEDNGNIELLPENNAECQPTNPDQINILRKIKFIKQNIIDNELADTSDVKKDSKVVPTITQDNGVKENNPEQNIIGNLQEKTQGFMMVRVTKQLNKPIDDSSPSPTQTDLPACENNFLALSIGEIRKSIDKIKTNKINKSKKHKQSSKSNMLTLSAITDKTEPSNQPTSRFRRLRIDEKTHIWCDNSITSVDTKMKNIPNKILQLSQSTSINIPCEVGNIKLHDVSSKKKLNEVAVCQHIHADPKTGPPKSRWRFWHFMCSMNNCEFDKVRMELEQTL